MAPERPTRPNSARLWLSTLAIAALPALLAVWTDRPATPLSADAPPTEFSEARAMPIVEELAGKIGHRLAGSEGARRAEKYLVARLREIPGLYVKVQDAEGVAGDTRYRVRNVLARLPGEEPTAVLVSAHYDSALGSVGAADDAVGVAAALEVARALAAGPKLKHSVLFNLNEGEELGLYGSHGFLSHPWARAIHAFVNLESAGAGGRPLLFQAGLPSLVSAYGRGAPHPHGSVFAQDVFASGIIPSDTDYRIYRDEGRRPGLDLALYQDGWAYHTHLDRVERLEPGSLQEMGANTLGFVRELAGDDLPWDEEPRSPIFYDLLGQVLVRYSHGTAAALTLLALVAMAFAVFAGVRHGRLTARSVLIGCALNALVFVVAVLFPIAIAWLLTGILERPFGWYPRPWLAVVAFGAPVIGVILATHGVIAAPWRERSAKDRALGDSARAMLLATQPLAWCFVLFVTTLYGLGSAYVALWWALPGAVALRLCVLRPGRPLLALAIGYLPGALVTSQLAVALVTNFVPMAGRMWLGFPMDYAIAAIVAVPTALCGLAAVPTLHHLPSRLWRPAAAVFLAVGIAATIYLAIATPHTAERPRRVAFKVTQVGELRRLRLEARDRLPLGEAVRGLPDGDAAKSVYYEPTELPAAASAEVSVVEWVEPPAQPGRSAEHRVTLRVRPNGAYYVSVRFKLQDGIAEENGKPLEIARFVNLPSDGLTFRIRTDPRETLEASVISIHADLHPDALAVMRALPPWVAPEPQVKVSRKVTLSR